MFNSKINYKYRFKQSKKYIYLYKSLYGWFILYDVFYFFTRGLEVLYKWQVTIQNSIFGKLKNINKKSIIGKISTMYATCTLFT